MMSKRAVIHQLLDLSPEHALDEMVCHLAELLGGCPSTESPTPAAPSCSPTVTIDGEVAQDAFHFSVSIASQGHGQSVPFILDTGAFEMLLMKDVADALHLPNDGPLQIQGVTGNAEAYQSHVDVEVTDAQGQVHTYQNIPCVVDPSATGNLFGFRFFQVTNQVVAVNPDTGKMGWYPASTLLS